MATKTMKKWILTDTFDFTQKMQIIGILLILMKQKKLERI